MGNNFRVEHGTASDLHFAPLAGKTDGSLFVQMRGNAATAHRTVYGSTTPEVTRSIRDALNRILGDTPALPAVVVDPVPDDDGDTSVTCGPWTSYVSKDGKGPDYGVEQIKAKLEAARKRVTAADFTTAEARRPYSLRSEIAALEKALERAEERAARPVYTREGDVELVRIGISATFQTPEHVDRRNDARAAAERLRENAYTA